MPLIASEDVMLYRKLSQEGELIAVRLSITRQGDAQKQIAVFADNIHQERNDE